jgi:chromosome partitioning protein
VDCDPQANATSALGINPETTDKNIYDVYMSVFEGFPDVTFEDIVLETSSGIDLAPSSLDLVGVEPFLYNIEGRTEILRFLLEPCVGAYDQILIDTPPSMGQFVLNGLVAADRTIVPLDAGVFSINGIEGLATIFDDIEENLGRKIIADMAIITRWMKEKESSSGLVSLIDRIFHADQIAERGVEAEHFKNVESSVKNYFADVYAVPYDIQVYESQERGMPLSHFAPESRAAMVYAAIADKIGNW